KKTFNLPLVYQGIERLKGSEKVYLAVERTGDLRRKMSKKWRDAEKLCRMLGLGLISVRFYQSGRKPRVDMICDAVPFTPEKSKLKTSRLKQEFLNRSMDYNVGGSTRTALVTAYRERALECAYWLRDKGPLRPKQLRELTSFVHAGKVVYDNYYGWFVRESKGVYVLSDKGLQALEHYRHIIDDKFTDELDAH